MTSIQAGDWIRLNVPFKPDRVSQEYSIGIVLGIVNCSSSDNYASETQVVIQLYDAKADQIYTDLQGDQALFCFGLNEMTLHQELRHPIAS